MTPVQILAGVIIIGVVVSLIMVAVLIHASRLARIGRDARRRAVAFAPPMKVVDYGNGMAELVQSDTISLEEWRRKTGITGPAAPGYGPPKEET